MKKRMNKKNSQKRWKKIDYNYFYFSWMAIKLIL